MSKKQCYFLPGFCPRQNNENCFVCLLSGIISSCDALSDDESSERKVGYFIARIRFLGVALQDWGIKMGIEFPKGSKEKLPLESAVV